MDQWGRPTTVEELEALIAKVPAAHDPYAAGWDVWGGAMVVAGTSEVAYDLWLLWGGLTDWVEAQADDPAEALDAMRRAAEEWAAVKSDAAARDRYFNHWLYEVVGYERPDAAAP